MLALLPNERSLATRQGSGGVPDPRASVRIPRPSRVFALLALAGLLGLVAPPLRGAPLDGLWGLDAPELLGQAYVRLYECVRSPVGVLEAVRFNVVIAAPEYLCDLR